MVFFIKILQLLIAFGLASLGLIVLINSEGEFILVSIGIGSIIGSIIFGITFFFSPREVI